MQDSISTTPMSHFYITADLGFDSDKYHVGLSLVEFKEDNVTIIHSPSLELSGYGYSLEEAKHSFTEALHEFFRYTNQKNTLSQILKDLDWI